MKHLCTFVVLVALGNPVLAQQTDAGVNWLCQPEVNSLSVSMIPNNPKLDLTTFPADQFRKSCTLRKSKWVASTSWLVRNGGPCSADPNLLITLIRNGRKIVDRVYADFGCREDDATFASAIIKETPQGPTIRLCFRDSGGRDHCKELAQLPATPIDLITTLDLLKQW
jgi:hypothetical protein